MLSLFRLSFTLWLILPLSTVFAEVPFAEFLKTHCISCHEGETKKGYLDLTKLPEKFDDPTTALRWVKVHDRIANGEMPPANKKRPEKAQVETTLKDLAKLLTDAEIAKRAKNGRSIVRRLNRTEYENTLRDLFDLPGLDVKDQLPDDGRANGYDKSAAALDISPILMSKYAEVADLVLDKAIAKYSVPPEVDRKTLYANQQYDFMVLMSGGDAVMLNKDQKYDSTRYPIPSGTGKYPEKQFSFGGKYNGLGEANAAGIFKEPSTVGVTRTQDESFQGRFAYSPIHPGRYEITVQTWAYWWDKGEVKPAPRDGAVGVYCGDRLLGHAPSPSMKPHAHTFNVWIDPKPRNILKIDPAYFWNVHVYFSQGQVAAYTGPGVAIDSLKVEGPFYDEWPPQSHRTLFGNLPVIPFHKMPEGAKKPKRVVPQQVAHDAHNGAGRLVMATVVSDNPEADALNLLKGFLPKAFRRPVAPEELTRYTDLVKKLLADGACFEDAMKGAYKTALCSPEFLFLTETVGELDSYAVASRLSYFLRNSMPDEVLFKLAAEKKLQDPLVLRTQADRMLNDKKAERFRNDFLDQWLDLREFDLTSPDRTLYPEFKAYLRDAIQQEPYEYFKVLLGSNHPISTLVDSNFLMLNQRLAEHYGIKDIKGTHFRVVNIPKESQRGGLLTTAAVLKVTANGTTTSPVKRGAWVQRKILGTPPEPPPPDITAVEPDVRGATTIREQLAKHRDNAACASCHAKMDPPGFALESFDPIGGLRDKYRATEKGTGVDLEKTFLSHLGTDGKFSRFYHVGFKMGLPVDCTGELPDGRKFKDVAEYRQLLLKDQRALARNFANQLIAYSTSAPVSFADRQAVEQVLDKSGGDYRMRAMIYELVQSPLFLKK